MEMPPLQDLIFGPGEDAHTDERRALWALHNDKNGIFRANEAGVIAAGNTGFSVNLTLLAPLAIGLVSGDMNLNVRRKASGRTINTGFDFLSRERIIVPAGREVLLHINGLSEVLIASAAPNTITSMLSSHLHYYTPILEGELIAAQEKVAEIAGERFAEIPREISDTDCLFKLGGHKHGRYRELFGVRHGFACFAEQDVHGEVTHHLLVPGQRRLIEINFGHACWISKGAVLYGFTEEPYISREVNDIPVDLEPPSLEVINMLLAEYAASLAA